MRELLSRLLLLFLLQVAGSGGVKSVWLRSSNSSASFNPGTAANGADQSQVRVHLRM